MSLSLGAAQTATPMTRRDAIVAIRAARDGGIGFFDTAAAYGPLLNEELVGEAIAPFRQEVVVSSKFGYEIVDGRVTALDSRPDAIRRSAEASLKRLGVDAIDLYYQQRADPSVPIEDVAGAVRELVSQGKVKHFGLCEASAATLRRAHAVLPVSVLQADYSLWSRGAESGLLDTLEELGIGLVSWNPLGQGYATGLDWSTAESLYRNRRLLKRIGAVAQRHGATVQQVASAWLSARRPWIVPMIDVTDLGRLRDGRSPLELELHGDELDDDLAMGAFGPPESLRMCEPMARRSLVPMRVFRSSP